MKIWGKKIEICGKNIPTMKNIFLLSKVGNINRKREDSILRLSSGNVQSEKAKLLSKNYMHVRYRYTKLVDLHNKHRLTSYSNNGKKIKMSILRWR